MFGVGLYCLGALRGLWGFYVRVELGGFGACGVFAFIFLLFAYRFISLPIFRGFAFVALLVLFACFVCSCVFVVAFSLSDYAQKERARRVGASSLVLLWACLDVLKHYRYFLRFIVPTSISFANDSCDRFRLFRWVVYYLPVFVNCRVSPII